MASIKQTLDVILAIDGAMCAAVIDWDTGLILGSAGPGVDMEIVAARNMELVRAKLKTMRVLGLNDGIEDVLITQGKQYHIVHPSASKDGVFLYVVFDKQRADLALARSKTHDADRRMNV